MQHYFNTIAIIGKPDDPAAAETVERIAERLHKAGCHIVLDEATVALENAAYGEIRPRHAFIEGCDLVIAVGGDGTLLQAARAVVGHDVPLLGVNRGRLGFLVDLSPSNLDDINRILDGDFIEDKRTLLNAEIRIGDRVINRGTALNDVVLHKWNTARMVDFDTYIDGELCNSHRSDGLIVSTSTGSTAYAMAGGGPIMHPNVDAILLVPICPHTLSNRPLLIHGNSTIEIVVHKDGYQHVRVSCDGQDDLGLVNGGRIFIQRNPTKLRLIHPPQYRYFDILRAKLRWGERHPI